MGNQCDADAVDGEGEGGFRGGGIGEFFFFWSFLHIYLCYW